MRTNNKTYREKQRFRQSVIHNFEVSVVMPCFSISDALTKILLKKVPYLQRNGIEVIFTIARITAKEKKGLIDQIKKIPFVNWKVIVIDQHYKFHNYATLVNTGIHHASKKYVLITCPEVEFSTDVILKLRELLKNYPKHFATETMAAVESSSDILDANTESLKWIDYGGVMVEKWMLDEIGRYDELINEWEDANENICRRLEMFGVKRLKVLQAKILCHDRKSPLRKISEKQNKYQSKDNLKIYYPQMIVANNNFRRQRNNKTIYDWQNNIYAEELCLNYLSKFLQYEIKCSSVFKNSYKKLVLCQAWNEEELMPGFLEDMAKYFDGIILLDDGSADNTWELANHEKILLKVKKERECFNDLGNRNILLDLASFFNSEWFCFVDIDERFDERFVDFSKFENDPNIDVVVFKEVFLWGNEYTYKGGIPYSHKGVRKIARMFRNIGHSRINTLKSKLHFIACPHFINNIFYSKILLKDYGSLEKNKRIKKYQMYIEEDNAKDIPSYDYLLDDKSDLYDLDKFEI